MSQAEGKTFVEVTECQVCESSHSTLLFAEDPYQIRRCSGCSLVFVTPRYCDNTIHEVYGQDYWTSDTPKTKGYADYASEAPLYLKTYKRRLGLVKRFCKSSAKVLDVGCAAGYFLRVMRDAGHDVYGVEISSPIAAEAKEHLGDERVHIGPLDSVDHEANQKAYAKGSFDLVTMWDVIEHVPNPQDLLRQALEMLKPDGHLILETQNVDSRFASMLGPKWHHYKHEEHIYHFNPSTIRKLLEQGGFETVKLTSDYGGKYVSFGFIAERAARINKVASLALKPLNLMRHANLYLNFRDEMVVVAKPHAAT